MTTFLSFTTGLFLGWIVRGAVIYMVEDYKQGRMLKENASKRRDYIDDLVIVDEK